MILLSEDVIRLEAGSGGRPCSGSASGLGSLLLISCGRLVASTTLWAGGFRLSAAVLLGKSLQVRNLVLVC